MSLFPKRPPRVMHGLAAMLGADKTGGFVTPPAGAVGPVAHYSGGPAGRKSDAEAADALNVLLRRLALAERRVELGLHYLQGFEAQASALPEGHVARQVADRMVTELRAVLKTEAP